MSIKVLDTRIYNDEIWLKVKLSRNTDILITKLYTEQDIEAHNQTAILKFLNWQGDQYFKWQLDNKE